MTGSSYNASLGEKAAIRRKEKTEAVADIVSSALLGQPAKCYKDSLRIPQHWVMVHVHAGETKTAHAALNPDLLRITRYQVEVARHRIRTPIFRDRNDQDSSSSSMQPQSPARTFAGHLRWRRPRQERGAGSSIQRR
jgi:hypothetical protein